MPHPHLQAVMQHRKSQKHQNKEFNRRLKLSHRRRKRQDYEISDNVFLIQLVFEHFQRLGSLQPTHFQTRNGCSSNNFFSHQFTLLTYALLLMYFAQPVVSQSEEHNSPLTNIPNNNKGAIFYLPNEHQTDFPPPIHHAILRGDNPEQVKKLIEEGFDINEKTQNGMTPLHIAVIRGKVDMAELLCSYGADINALLIDGSTPLMQAILANQTPAASFLISQGADIHIKFKGNTALHVAANKGNAEIIDILLNHGANIHERTKESSQFSSLEIAAQNGHLEAMHRLVQYGANLNANIKPILFSVNRNDLNAVKKLIEWGTHLDSILTTSPDEDVAPLLHLAAKHNNAAMINLLLKHATALDINAVDGHDLETALHVATKKGSTEAAQALIAHGADIHTKTAFGKTALDIATSKNHTQIIKLLKKEPLEKSDKEIAKATLLMTYSNMILCGIAGLYAVSKIGSKFTRSKIDQMIEQERIKENKKITDYQQKIKSNIKILSRLTNLFLLHDLFLLHEWIYDYTKKTYNLFLRFSYDFADKYAQQFAKIAKRTYPENYHELEKISVHPQSLMQCLEKCLESLKLTVQVTPDTEATALMPQNIGFKLSVTVPDHFKWPTLKEIDDVNQKLKKAIFNSSNEYKVFLIKKEQQAEEKRANEINSQVAIFTESFENKISDKNFEFYTEYQNSLKDLFETAQIYWDSSCESHKHTRKFSQEIKAGVERTKQTLEKDLNEIRELKNDIQARLQTIQLSLTKKTSNELKSEMDQLNGELYKFNKKMSETKNQASDTIEKLNQTMKQLKIAVEKEGGSSSSAKTTPAHAPTPTLPALSTSSSTKIRTTSKTPSKKAPVSTSTPTLSTPTTPTTLSSAKTKTVSKTAPTASKKASAYADHTPPKTDSAIPTTTTTETAVTDPTITIAYVSRSVFLPPPPKPIDVKGKGKKEDKKSRHSTLTPEEIQKNAVNLMESLQSQLEHLTIYNLNDLLDCVILKRSLAYKLSKLFVFFWEIDHKLNSDKIDSNGSISDFEIWRHRLAHLPTTPGNNELASLALDIDAYVLTPLKDQNDFTPDALLQTVQNAKLEESNLFEKLKIQWSNKNSLPLSNILKCIIDSINEFKTTSKCINHAADLNIEADRRDALKMLLAIIADYFLQLKNYPPLVQNTVREIINQHSSLGKYQLYDKIILSRNNVFHSANQEDIQTDALFQLIQCLLSINITSLESLENISSESNTIPEINAESFTSNCNDLNLQP